MLLDDRSWVEVWVVTLGEVGVKVRVVKIRVEVRVIEVRVEVWIVKVRVEVWVKVRVVEVRVEIARGISYIWSNEWSVVCSGSLHLVGESCAAFNFVDVVIPVEWPVVEVNRRSCVNYVWEVWTVLLVEEPLLMHLLCEEVISPLVFQELPEGSCLWSIAGSSSRPGTYRRIWEPARREGVWVWVPITRVEWGVVSLRSSSFVNRFLLCRLRLSWGRFISSGSCIHWRLFILCQGSYPQAQCHIQYR